MGFMDKLYGIAGKVGDTFEKGAKNVSDGSKKAMDKMRINKEINQTKGEINSIYTQIGKKCFELNSENPSNEYADMVNDINEKLAKIETLNNELKALEESKINCPNCGALIEKGAKFCEKCGTNVENVPPVVSAVPVDKSVNSTTVTEDNSPEASAVENTKAETSVSVTEEEVSVAEKAASNKAEDDNSRVDVQNNGSSPFNTNSSTVDSGWQSAPSGDVQTSNKLHCQSCGAVVENDQNFCEKCGSKIEK